MWIVYGMVGINSCGEYDKMGFIGCLLWFGFWWYVCSYVFGIVLVDGM